MSKKSSSKASGSLGTDDDAFDVPTTSSEYRRWRGKPPSLPRFPEGVYGRGGGGGGTISWVATTQLCEKPTKPTTQLCGETVRRVNRRRDGDEGRVTRATGTRGPRCTRWREAGRRRGRASSSSCGALGLRRYRQTRGRRTFGRGSGRVGTTSWAGRWGMCWPGGWCRPAATGLGLRLNSSRR